jgi:GTPase
MLKCRDAWIAARSQPSEFYLDETYSVTGVGTVVAGTLVSGIVKTNDNLLLGPGEKIESINIARKPFNPEIYILSLIHQLLTDGFGHFNLVAVKSIHTNCMPVDEVFAGQSCSFALKKVKRKDVRKGMVS